MERNSRLPSYFEKVFLKCQGSSIRPSLKLHKGLKRLCFFFSPCTNAQGHPAVSTQLLKCYILYLKKYNVRCFSLYKSIQSSASLLTLQTGTVVNVGELMHFLCFRSLLWETVVTFERLHSLIIHVRSVTVCVWGCAVQRGRQWQNLCLDL